MAAVASLEQYFCQLTTFLCLSRKGRLGTSFISPSQGFLLQEEDEDNYITNHPL